MNKMESMSSTSFTSTTSSSESSASSASSKSTSWRDYHIVNAKDLKRGVAKKTDRVREFTLRANYTRKHYRNRYDVGHRAWMRRLAKDFDVADLLAMPLDNVIAMGDIGLSAALQQKPAHRA
jgi:hypothetical protein